MSYVDVDIVGLDSSTKHDEPLAEVGELPHVPDSGEHRELLRRLGGIAVDLVEGPLAS